MRADCKSARAQIRPSTNQPERRIANQPERKGEKKSLSPARGEANLRLSIIYLRANCWKSLS